MPATDKLALRQHSRLCFYPSSGDTALWVLMRLDCDLFVLADKCREAVSWQRIQADFKKNGQPVELVHSSAGHLCFRSLAKTVWIFLEDNSAALERLHRAHLSIHHFVGIGDGCCEGGNHACVHERPFLSCVLPLASQGMVYTTDHSRPLERRPYNWEGIPRHPKFMNRVAWHSFPEPPTWEHADQCDWQHEQVNPSVRFDLQGVLVARQRRTHAPLTKSDLQVLPKGDFSTQLENLIPLRLQYGRGVLAEYRVFW